MTSSQDHDKHQAIRLLRRYRALPPEEQTRQRDSLIANYRAKEFWNRVRENHRTGEFPISGSREYLLHGRGIRFPVGIRQNGSLIYKKENVNFLGKWLRQKQTNPWTRNRVGGPTLPHRVHQEVISATHDVPTLVYELSELLDEILMLDAQMLDARARYMAAFLSKLRSAIRAHKKGYLKLTLAAIVHDSTGVMKRMNEAEMRDLIDELDDPSDMSKAEIIGLCAGYYVPYLQLFLLEEVHHHKGVKDIRVLSMVRLAKALTKAYTPRPIVDAMARYMERLRRHGGHLSNEYAGRPACTRAHRLRNL
jgi:hypothetical protein